MAKNHYSFEKRRKELEKKKKKEAKRQRKLDRKAEGEGGSGPPIGELDEFGNPIEPEAPVETDAAEPDAESPA